MLKIIAKATLLFRNPDKPSETYRTTPTEAPVEAPDWLEDNDLFELAVADGSIIVPQEAGKPSASTLKKVPLSDLVAELLARPQGDVANELQKAGAFGSYGTAAGTNVQPISTSAKAKADAQARAEAANNANSGKTPSTELQAEPVKQGDERTAREDAATKSATDQAADTTKRDGSDKPDPGTPGAAAEGITVKDADAKPATKTTAGR